MKYGRNSDTPALLRALPSQPNADTLGARLRDHVRPGLPYPFPPIRALCDVSPSLLFSSLPLGKPVQLSWNLGLVYTAPAGKSIVHFQQKSGEKVWASQRKERKNVDSDKKCPNFVKNKTRQAALTGRPAGTHRIRVYLLLFFFWRLIRVMRLSLRIERRVPRDWKICTRITMITTATSMTASL